MPFNGSGTFNRLYSWQNDATLGIKIRADRMDNEDNGFATGLTTCVTRDGQSPWLADLPAAGFKITGAANAAGAGEFLVYGQDSAVVGGAFAVTKNFNGSTILSINNNDAGAANLGELKISNGTHDANLIHYGVGFTPAGLSKADGTLLVGTGAGGLTLNASLAQPIFFGTTNLERMRLDATGNLLVGSTAQHGAEKFRVNGVGYFDGAVTVAGAFNSLTSITSTNGDLSAPNGNILSGNTVSATGFGQLVTLAGPQISITAGGGTVQYDVVPRINGVRLSDAATSWSAISTAAKKKNLQLFEGDIHDIVMSHTIKLGHYLEDDDNSRLRPFVMYEDAAVKWPYATTHTDAEFYVNPKTNQVESREEYSGLSLEQYVPAIMLALQDIYHRIGA